jgi:hypothetical protein
MEREVELIGFILWLPFFALEVNQINHTINA